MMEKEMRKYLNKVYLINESIFKSMKDEVIQILEELGLLLNDEKEQQIGSFYSTSPKNGVTFEIKRNRPRGFTVATNKNDRKVSLEQTYELKRHLKKMLEKWGQDPKKVRAL